MAIESAAYIGEMNDSIPAEMHSVSEGAAQIRAVKHALLESFPEVKGRVSVTHTQLNETPKAVFAVGMIMPFWGDTLPKYWAWCDGANGTPNLNTADVTYIAGTSGAKGASLGVNTEDLTHFIGINGHALTEAQMPAHKHIGGINHGYDVNGFGLSSKQINGWFPDYRHQGGKRLPFTSTVGGGQAHSHNTRKIKDHDNRPKTLTMKYIMYRGV